ncbi:hypothetical protein ACKWTF_000616 [Chironomus riparius]
MTSKIERTIPKSKVKNSSHKNDLIIPLIDDSVIANIDNIITAFKLPHQDLKTENQNYIKSLNELQKVKELLQKINLESSSSASTVKSSNASISDNELIRNSIEMLKNGGKFVKPISTVNSSSSTASTNNLAPKFSLSSLKNAITVSSCKFNQKPSKNIRKVTRKSSRSLLTKKSEMSEQKTRINKQKVNNEKLPPKIVKTSYATCRIHQYNDNSRTFEINKPRSVSCCGDSNHIESEIVIVVMADGNTALFASEHSSLLDMFNHNGNRVKS